MSVSKGRSRSTGPGLLAGNPPPRWGAPGEDQAAPTGSASAGPAAHRVPGPVRCCRESNRSRASCARRTPPAERLDPRARRAGACQPHLARGAARAGPSCPSCPSKLPELPADHPAPPTRQERPGRVPSHSCRWSAPDSGCRSCPPSSCRTPTSTTPPARPVWPRSRPTSARSCPYYASVHRGAGYASQVSTALYERARATGRRRSSAPAATTSWSSPATPPTR